MNPKHYARALQVIAHHRCVTDLTDGFCGPKDGLCVRERISDNRKCATSAAAILRALEANGMSVVWDYDPANKPPP